MFYSKQHCKEDLCSVSCHSTDINPIFYLLVVVHRVKFRFILEKLFAHVPDKNIAEIWDI